MSTLAERIMVSYQNETHLVHKFFFGHFPLHEFFFGFSPHPPPPNHFSDGPSLMLMLTERLQDVVVWVSENGRSGASDHQKKKQEKPPEALDPAVVLPPRGGGCKICYGHSR